MHKGFKSKKYVLFQEHTIISIFPTYSILRNFVYQKIIRVINSFIVHLNAACASLEDIIKPTPL